MLFNFLPAALRGGRPFKQTPNRARCWIPGLLFLIVRLLRERSIQGKNDVQELRQRTICRPDPPLGALDESFFLRIQNLSMKLLTSDLGTFVLGDGHEEHLGQIRLVLVSTADYVHDLLVRNEIANEWAGLRRSCDE